LSTTTKKFKRDYIILEAKDMNFRLKDRATPKAFAKVEINEDKAVVALYVENVKFVKEGYKVVVIESDYTVRDIGRIIVNQQGKGEFVLNLNDEDIEVKAVALTYERRVPLIGFKGAKIDNYEDIIFIDEEEYEEEYEDEYEEEENDEEYRSEEDEEVDYKVEEEPSYEGYTNQEKYEKYKEQEKYEEFKVEQSSVEQGKQEYSDVKTEEAQRNHNENYGYEENTDERENNYDVRNSRPYLMPRKVKKVLKKYKEVKPFTQDVIKDTRWWKIDINPTSLCNYSLPCLGYVNYLNYTMYTDCVMHSYKYRHYVFGVQYDDYGRRKYYIYGVPGTRDEQPDQGFTGFYKYIPCDCKDSKLGYWLCFIDARTREIYYE
jgi:hypothetical protein